MRKFLYVALLTFGFGVLAQTPIIDYQFDGSVKDSQGNIDGILVNGGTLAANRFGKTSSALLLDGINQYVNIDNGGAAIVSTGKITLEGWFNSNDFSTTQFILNIPELIVFVTASGFPGMAPQDGISSSPVLSSTGINKNEWFHLAATYDGSIARIYVNGVETNSSQQDKTLQTNSGVTNVGANIGNNNVFPGLMDDVSFYDFALSDSEVLALYQEGAFITTWETTADNEQITIPTNVSYTYDYTVDWGDGEVVSGFTGSVSHTYATAGTYTIAISGEFPAINFSSAAANGSGTKIQSIEQWGDINWLDFTDAFHGCTNLVINATDAPNLINTTSLFAMFSSTNFSADFTHWDVSTITDTREMFSGSLFNGNISNWDVSNVTLMNNMFSSSSFTGDISGWDVSGVTQMNAMFMNSVFDGDISNWSVDNVTNMTDLFRNSIFNGDISGWNVGNVSGMGRMFLGAQFNQDISSWTHTNLVFSFSMFQNNPNFNQDISGWNMGNVINMRDMFNGATSFDQNIGAWDISSTTDLSRVFDNSAMSIVNYDNTLNGWSTLDTGAGETSIPTGITMGATGLKYCESTAARANLITNFTWTFSGDVLDCPDLLAQYPLDGNALDASDYGFDGTVFEAELAVDRFGNDNSAYSFDGVDDKISVAVTNQMPTNLTMSAWFYFPEGGGDNTHQILEINGAAALAIAGGLFQTILNLNGDFQVTGTNVTHSEWHLGTLTFDGNFMRSYLDGVLFDERENTGPIQYLNSSSPINIGTTNFGENFFNGSIDNVIISKRALSDTEITDLYNENGWINPRLPLATLYSSLGGDNWINNTNWNSGESLANWHGITLENGNLTALYLDNNNLVGVLPSEMGDFTNLSILWMHNNAISGAIPLEIANMVSMQQLVLFNNQLFGSIPPEMGNMNGLIQLYLGGNDLVGELPPELGNLTNLQLLRVNGNQLSGAVPPEYANLSVLTNLYLFGNQFTSLPDLTSLPNGFTLRVENNKIGFTDLITNLPIEGTGSIYTYSPQTVDGEEIITAADADLVSLSTTEVTAGTNYQWYFNDVLIDGAISVTYDFNFNSSLEGTYTVQMTNDNIPNLTITRESYLVEDGVNVAPTIITFADGTISKILKEGVPIGTLAGVFITEDIDPVDTYTYTTVAGSGDSFNSSIIISNDSVFTLVEMDPVSAPVHQFRVRSTDSGGEFVEQMFEIQISPIHPCHNDTFTATSGSFEDGSGIFDYEANFSCNWLIELSSENQVRLQFTEFDTEQDYDFVRVYDGSDETGTLLAELSGVSIPQSIISSSNTMFITFVSDGATQSTGWSATYSQVTPVADYPFTDGSTDDVSGYGNHVITNKAFVTSDRLGEGAYYFDGSTSYMQASSTLSGSGVPFTISTWVRWDGNNSDFTEIVSWWNASSTAKVYLGTSAGSNELRFGDAYGPTGAFIPANEWVHIAATHDGSISSIYINGTLSANSAAGVSHDFGGGDLFIGKQGTNDSEYFGGIIDEIKIYDISLSANEISNLYSATSTSLIAYLPFSNGLDDASSNGYDASDLGSGNVFSNDRLGVATSAFDFDIVNAGALEISSFANHNFGDEITVMGWIRPDTYPANDIQLFNNSYLSGSGFEFRLVKEDLTDDTKRKLFAGVTGISYGSAGEVAIDQWTHVAFKFKRGLGTSLYVNGTNLQSYGFVAGTDDLPIPISADGILIGEGYDGFMDEIKVFSTALTDQEILNEYNENLWPFVSLAFRGPENSGENTIDQGLAINPGDASSYLGAKQLYFDGDYQFRATASNFEAFMGDNELDGIAEPESTQLALTAGFYALGFSQNNFEYFVEPINTVGIIGSALTGDETGWNSDIDLVDLGGGIFQIQNLSLFDGEFKLRINDAWDFIDWGSNNLDGNLDYRGANVPISAGMYTFSFDLLNNKYTVIDVASYEAVAELDFSGNLLDDSGYGNDGFVSSPMYTAGRFGSVNAAIVLDGTSGVNLGNDASINLTNGFTMNLWINPTDNTGGREMFASGGSFHNHLYPTEITWRYFQNGVETGIDGIPVEAPNNTWTMLTWTYDGGAMRFYDDGVLVYSETVYGDLDVNANSYGIGGTFIGAIDAFQWIDGVLSDKEIQYLYTDNIILDYALDGNTDDQSGNNIHGSLPNGGVYANDRFGVVSSALSLDGGTQYVLANNGVEPLLTGNEVTLEGWFNTTTISASQFLMVTPGVIAYLDDFGNPSFAPQDEFVSNALSGPDPVNVNEWFHFAGTYDGSTSKIYIDGIEVASSQIDKTMNLASYETTIGGDNSSNFSGSIDDVTIYNYALNTEEIAELYGENDFASPLISGIFPTSGAPGSSIRVYGKNLAQAGAAISFGETVVTPTSIADNVLYFDVPEIASGGYDLVVSNSFDASLSKNFTILNTNESAVSFGPSNLITSGVSQPVELHSADLNGDNYPDLLAASFSEGRITSYINDANGGFGPPTNFFSSSNIGSVGLSTIRSGDLDRDGDLDLVTTYLNNLYYHENDGTGTIIGSVLIDQLLTTDDQYRDIQLGDLNGDAFLDIVVSNTDGTIDWFSNDGSGSFSNEGIIISSPLAFKLSLNDLDNDGDLDIAQANSANFILLNDGLGVFTKTDLTSTASGYHAVITADFNNDDLIDMVAGAQNDHNVDVYFNGVGTPTNIRQASDGVSPVDFSIGDIDGDGDTDLITAFLGGDLTLYINDGAGGFTAQIVNGNSDLPLLSRATATDMDNDGDLDIIISTQNDVISWFENQIPSDKKEILTYDLSKGATPSEVDYSLIGEFEGSRYYQSTSADTWTNAKATAEALGGHLATVHSQAENDFITDDTQSVWIGGSDEDVEGIYRWVDGTPLDYTNWDATEPNGGTVENHIELSAVGLWNDLDDASSLFYVVEIPFYEGLVDAANTSISVEVPFGTDVTSLIANFALSQGATAESIEILQESGITINDFSSDVDYLVTAEDLTFKSWTVTVSVYDGLLAFYPFNDNTSDQSGNGISLTLDGAISTEDRFGNANAAYNFDGVNDQLTRSNTDLLGGEYETSLVFWANPSRNDVFQDLMNFGNIRAFSDESGRLKFQLFTEASSGTYDAELEIGVWQQFVLTYDKDSISIYKDAILTDKVEKYGAIDANSLLLFIGSAGGNNFYQGGLDDIQLYDRALSEVEIQTLYNEGGWPFANTETDIVAFSVAGETENKVINAIDHTVDIEVDFNMDISALTPSFTLSEGAIAIANSELQESDVSIVDFTNPITYSIVAEDNTTTQDWLVTVALDSVQGDSLALVELYNSTSGDNWTTSWDILNLPMTEWSGVVLDADRRVTGLELNANNLVGSIPSSIGNLSRLTSLNLSVNNISGSLPSSIGSLSNLTLMNFESNALTGSIPIAIGNLNKLNNLNLLVNELSGSIPPVLGSIPELYYLNLGRNKLTGSIPTQLGDLSSLITLNLSDNNLAGSIPASLGNIGSSLEILFLGSNSLEGSIPEEISNLVNLTRLELYSNSLSGSIPIELGSMTALTNLNFSGNRLSGEIPLELGSLTSLTSLSLEGNSLSGSIPSEIGGLTGLIGMHLGSNKLTGSIPTSFSGLTSIHDLGLEHNQLNSIPDLTGLPLSNEGLAVNSNKIGFSDIITNISISKFSYDPQIVQDTIRDLISGSYPMSTVEETSGTSYQWTKDGSDIADTNAATYEATEPGTYTVVMINSNVPDLTITRAPYILTGGDATEIITFSFDGFDSEVVLGDGTINIEVPFASPSLSSLVAIFELSPGASASIGGTPQTSGIDANDFAGTVTYTVTAQDGTTTQNWVVSTTVGPNPANDIENFDIANMVGDEVINSNNHTISVLMPYLTDRAALTPSISISVGATINPETDTEQDFSTSFSYTVTSQSGVDQNWSVTVTNQLNNETDIESFVIPGQSRASTIDENNHTVTVEMPFGTDVSSLTPTITLSSGATVFPNSGATQNFNNAVIYTVTPQNNTASQQWTVTVNVDPNVNSVPTALNIDNIGINENFMGLIGSFNTDDADGTDSHVYSLINGVGATNNASFAIAGNELSSLVAFDFETKNSYSILVRTDDQRGGFLNRQFTINVIDVNEAPNIASQSFSIDENASNQVLVGTVVASDVDGNLLGFSIIGGNTGNAFNIDNNGNITVADQTQLDFETTPVFNLIVNASDGSLSSDATITVNLNDLIENVAPDDITFSPVNNSENTAAGSPVGTLSSNDPDGTDDTHTYSLISGDFSNFEIVNNELRNTSVLDFEVQSSYVMTIRSTDQDGALYDEELTIDIVNVNEETTFSNLQFPTEYSSGSFDVSATITDEDGLLAFNLFYRKVSQPDFSSKPLTKDGDSYSASLNDSEIGNIGVEVYLEVSDAFGTESTTETTVSVTVPDGSKSVNGKFSAGTTVQDYSILAFPFKSVSVQNTFGSIGAYDEDWRLITYQNGSLSDKSSGNTSAGTGYWFITKNQSASVTIGGESVDLSADGSYSITLRPDSEGYSLIGNPFQGTIDWGIVKTFNENNGNIGSGASVSNLIRYNSGFVSDQTSLGELEGAFVQATGVTQIDIPASAISGGGGRVDEAINSPHEIYIDDNDWKLDLFFTTPSYSYSVGGVGMNAEAQDGRDGYDLGILPRLELYLDLLFEDGSTRSIKKSDDFKSWSFNVRNNLPEELIDMTWDIPVSSNKTIILVDESSQKIYDLKETKSIQLENNPSATHQLYYGDRETIYQNLKLPFDAYVGSYPNPVEQEMTLKMYSSNAGSSSVELVSLDGKSYPIGQIQLYEGLNTEKINLDAYSIPAGLYFLKVNGKVTTKILKQ